MNRRNNLHIALAAVLLLALGTGCASVVGKPPKPNPVPNEIVLPTEKAEPAIAAKASPDPQAPVESVPQAANDSSAPSPAPSLTSDRAPSPKPAVPTARPAVKRASQLEHSGYLSKTPVALPPSTKPDGSLTRLDEMKKQGTMSEDEYGQIKRQILENQE